MKFFQTEWRKNFKNVDFSPWGNCATTQIKINVFWNFFLTPHPLRGPSTWKKFKKTLIWAFEANSAFVPQNWTFFCVLAHCVIWCGYENMSLSLVQFSFFSLSLRPSSKQFWEFTPLNWCMPSTDVSSWN